MGVAERGEKLRLAYHQRLVRRGHHGVHGAQVVDPHQSLERRRVLLEHREEVRRQGDESVSRWWRCHDLERGGRLEVAWLSGDVVARGQRLGISTPCNRAIFDILSVHSEGKPT